MRLLSKDIGSSDCFAMLDISAKRAKELLAMRKVWEELHKTLDTLYGIEAFNYEVLWYEDIDLAPVNDEAQEGIEQGYWARVPVKGDDAPVLPESMSVSVACIRYTSGGVLWTASPKHSDGNYETQELTWDDLEAIAKGKF